MNELKIEWTIQDPPLLDNEDNIIYEGIVKLDLTGINTEADNIIVDKHYVGNSTILNTTYIKATDSIDVSLFRHGEKLPNVKVTLT